jgi:hypothetical protein
MGGDTESGDAGNAVMDRNARHDYDVHRKNS